jgi:hypothetical protein
LRRFIASVDLFGPGATIRAMRQDDLRETVAMLQQALDRAHQRIREQEQAGAEMNRRFAEVQAQRDQLEMRLYDSDAEARRRG